MIHARKNGRCWRLARHWRFLDQTDGFSTNRIWGDSDIPSCL
ncbi:Uncharacterized protein ChrSV_3861 [Chromobacterium vaccinii]|nr:Uncharacterized protein ChrSW_3861 [Chromobacterium vaccinii]QND91318.1 Uncharacterized protein ChrSV_3861 [Chromobacterium vaccinii]